MIRTRISILFILFTLTCMSCNTQRSSEQNNTALTSFSKEGTYGYDLNFLKSQGISVHELVNESGGRALIVPSWQGRVMTSTSNGLDGKSYGWINYDFIQSGEKNPKFNPYGGEERFWLGPEGGPFSLYFEKNEDQTFENWNVPTVLDTDPFEIQNKRDESIQLKKSFSLENASGNTLNLEVTREVSILSEGQVWETLGVKDFSSRLQSISFESRNTIVNTGNENWDSDYGFVSIWLLCMFNPSEQGVVFTKLAQNQEGDATAVTDDYFGKVPADRLKVIDEVVYFKVDGKLRSKIGIAPYAASEYVGSYDPVDGILTILWYKQPLDNMPYVNSQWGNQEDPLEGDVINSYNDGPNESGTTMGPFYEIESSSPAALLKPEQKLTHKQRIYHIKGSEEYLEPIVEQLFGTSISQVKNVFNVELVNAIN